MKKNIPLFYPNVTREMKQAAWEAMGEKILTQGKTVDEFEKKFGRTLDVNNVLSVNSGTSALELAFHLLNLKAGDEVISPVFTFIGANVPLARSGVKVVFADVKDNLLLDWDDALSKITKKTKAIIQAHLFDQINETRNTSVPVVGDAAQCLAKTSGEKFTVYSFQAVKRITTVDGGVLICREHSDYLRGKLLRWYGIDRETGQDKAEVDITEAGYKYHMSNVTAAIGIEGLKVMNKLRKKIDILKNSYYHNLKDLRIKVISGSPFLIHVSNRERLIQRLANQGIETGLTIRRNDLYSIFGSRRKNLPNMNRLESTYLLLPCHNHMSLKDVEFICKQIRKSL